MSEYCPNCQQESPLVPNPYYIHICDHCGWRGDNRSLLTEAKARPDDSLARLRILAADLQYELTPHPTTKHPCRCGRMGTRRGQCALCVIEEMIKVKEGMGNE